MPSWCCIPCPSSKGAGRIPTEHHWQTKSILQSLTYQYFQVFPAKLLSTYLSGYGKYWIGYQQRQQRIGCGNISKQHHHACNRSSTSSKRYKSTARSFNEWPFFNFNMANPLKTIPNTASSSIPLCIGFLRFYQPANSGIYNKAWTDQQHKGIDKRSQQRKPFVSISKLRITLFRG